MIRTHIIECHLSQTQADALNRASAQRYTQVMLFHWRTTIWKQSAIRRRGETILLARARNQPPISIALPIHLRELLRILEVRLVYDRRAQRYTWHLVVENGKQPNAPPGTNVVSVDLGEIHPAAEI